MTREQLLVIAERSADVAWRVMKGPKPFGWVEALDAPGGLAALCEWLEQLPARSASELYRFATRERPGASPWLGIPRELRVAIETFRAMYVLHLPEVQLADVNVRREHQGWNARATNVVPFPGDTAPSSTEGGAA